MAVPSQICISCQSVGHCHQAPQNARLHAYARPQHHISAWGKPTLVLRVAMIAMFLLLYGVAVSAHSREQNTQPAVQLAARSVKKLLTVPLQPVDSNNTTPLQELPAPFPVTCTSGEESKQSCMFTNVCLHLNQSISAGSKPAITAILQGSTQTKHAAILQRHLHKLLQGMFSELHCELAGDMENTTGAFNVSAFQLENKTTLLWQLNPGNQYSFGHALINETQLGSDVSADVQVLATGNWSPVLKHLVTGTITQNAQLLQDKLANLHAGRSGLCFPQLIVGDGGYVSVSRASLANSGQNHAQQFSREPSFFSSTNWWHFKQHAWKVNGIATNSPLAPTARPTILLNDKRFGKPLQGDRRMIINIDAVASNISALFPTTEVRPVRFRDLNFTAQLQQLSQAKVLITTQGSSAFRMVFLPKGAFCIIIGSPDPGGKAIWKSFHELDRWFPLTYVQFMRYKISANSTGEYDAPDRKGWNPGDPEERRQWTLYNADMRLNMTKIQSMLDEALRQPRPF